jgi:hypothetical protein
MAIKYCKSGAAGAADGSTWTDAYTTLTAALAGVSAGDTIYVSHQHAESTAGAVTLTSPGTAASPVRILCANDGATPPTALATTGTVDTTGANALTIGGGFAYVYGLKFTAGSAANSAALNVNANTVTWWRLEQCTLKLGNTNAASRINFGGLTGQDDNLYELINSHLEFGATGQFVQVGTRVVWQGGSLVNATIPTALLTSTANTTPGILECRAVDLSAAGSGKTIVTGTTGNVFEARFENCKLGASVTLSGTPAGQGGARVTFVNCDSGDTNYRYAKHAYQGTITQESTIVRSSGASDGTTAISRKMVSTANSKFFSPLESDPIYIWNENTGSAISVTAEVVTDNVTLTDAEAWIEVEYLGTSGVPLGSVATDRAADILATPANQTSSSVTWTTTGLTTPTKQKLVASFTPQEKGLLRAKIMLAKASTTMYYCPKLAVA